ncbi:argininosuccinate synthase [Serratia ureilytica]
MVAARAVEQLVLDRDSFKWREQLGLEMSYVVYDGRWFAPLRRSLQASAEALAEEVNGEVVLQLYKGQVTATQKNPPTACTPKSSPPSVKTKFTITATRAALSACLSVFTHPRVEREKNK